MDCDNKEILFQNIYNKLNNSDKLIHKRAFKLHSLLKDQLGVIPSEPKAAKLYIKKLVELISTLINRLHQTMKTNTVSDDDLQNIETLTFLLAVVLRNVSLLAIRKSTTFILDIINFFLMQSDLPVLGSKKYFIIILEKLITSRVEFELKDDNDIVVSSFVKNIFRLTEDRDPTVQKQLIKTFSRILVNNNFVECTKMTILLKLRNFLIAKLKGLGDNTEKVVGMDIHSMTDTQGFVVIKFLSSVIQFLPFDVANDIMLELLNTIHNSNTNIVRYTLLCMEVALSSKSFAIEILESIMKALLQLDLILNEEENSEEDKQLLAFYIKTMSQVIIAISRKNILLCLNYMVSVFSLLGEYLTNEDIEIKSMITNNLNSILSNVLSNQHLDFLKKTYFNNNAIQSDEDMLVNLTLGNNENMANTIKGNLEKISNAILYLVGDRFSGDLKMSFTVLYTYMERIHKYDVFSDIVENIIQNVSEITDLAKKVAFKNFLGKCFNIVEAGIIFKYFPIQCLDFDIEDNDYSEISRVWILTYISKFLKTEKSLKEFFESFLFIIQDLERILGKLENNEKIFIKARKTEKVTDGMNDGEDVQIDEEEEEEIDDQNFDTNKNESQHLRVLKMKRYELLLVQIWNLCPSFCAYDKNAVNEYSEHVKYFLDKIDECLVKYPQTKLDIIKSLSKIINNAKLRNDVATITILRKDGKKYFIRVLNWILALKLTQEETREGYVLLTNFCKILSEKYLYTIVCDQVTAINDNNKINEAIPKEQKEVKGYYTNSKTILAFRLNLINYLVKSLNINDNMTELIQTFVQNNYFNTSFPTYLKKNMLDLFLIMLHKEKDQAKVLMVLNSFINSNGISLVQSSKQKSKLLEYISEIVLENIKTKETKEAKIDLLKENYKIIIEIIELTKDLNRKVRNCSYDIIANFTEKLSDEGIFNDWVNILFSVFASNSESLMSSGINALARVFWQQRDEKHLTLLLQTYDMVCLLFRQNSKEITKSIYLFLRVYLFIITDNNVIISNLGKIIENVFTISTEAIKTEFKVKIRNLIKNLIMKIGYEELKKVFPVKHLDLLNYINKFIVKKIKKYPTDEEQVYLGQKLDDTVMMDNDENLLKDDEEEYIEKEFKKLEKNRKTDEEKFLESLERLDIDENEKGERPKDEPTYSKEETAKRSKSKKTNDKIQNMLHNNDIELDTFFQVNPYVKSGEKKTVKITDPNANPEDTNNDVFYNKNSGKLIIKNAEEKTYIRKKKNRAGDDEKENGNDSDEDIKTGDGIKIRKIHENAGIGSGVRENYKKPVQGHVVKYSGQEYKGKKGKGDLLLKNKPEPFAYIQLNPKANSKKRRKDAVKVFEDVMKKGKGSLNGLKIKK